MSTWSPGKSKKNVLCSDTGLSHLRFLWIGIVDEVAGLFVDAEVCQMDKVVRDDLGVSGVVLGGEPEQSRENPCSEWERCVPCETFLVDVDTERIHAGHQDVYPEVEFQIVDQIRSLDITLDTKLGLLIRDFFEVVDHSDSHPAEQVRGFDDPEVVGMIFHVSGNFFPVVKS